VLSNDPVSVLKRLHKVRFREIDIMFQEWGWEAQDRAGRQLSSDDPLVWQCRDRAQSLRLRIVDEYCTELDKLRTGLECDGAGRP
jgi:hypothetical protein